MARFRPAMPIVAFSPDPRTVRQLTLSWGAIPLQATASVHSLDLMDDLIVAARDEGHVQSGQLVAVLAGAGDESVPATDVLRLSRVP
jgi:pyruvate kinase